LGAPRLQPHDRHGPPAAAAVLNFRLHNSIFILFYLGEAALFFHAVPPIIASPVLGGSGGAFGFPFPPSGVRRSPLDYRKTAILDILTHEEIG
jgi:hypothetical protein